MQVSDAIHLPDEFALLIPVIQGIDQRCPVRMDWRNADLVGATFRKPLGT